MSIAKAGLSPEMIRVVHETEARALARARDLVDQPESNVLMLQFREALRIRSEAVLIASAVMRTYDDVADRIIANLRA